MAAVDKTQMEGRRKAPFFRPELWAVAAALVCGVTTVFCLVQQLRSCSVVVVACGLLVWLAMASGAAVVAAAAVVTWITMVVLLAFIGRSRRRLVAEGRKIIKEIMVGFVVKVLLEEANVLAALCAAVLGCLAFAWPWGPFLSTANYFG